MCVAEREIPRFIVFDSMYNQFQPVRNQEIVVRSYSELCWVALRFQLNYVDNGTVGHIFMGFPDSEWVKFNESEQTLHSNYLSESEKVFQNYLDDCLLSFPYSKHYSDTRSRLEPRCA